MVDALSDEAARARTGDPFDDDVLFGPLISGTHRDKVEGLLARLPGHATGGGRGPTPRSARATSTRPPSWSDRGQDDEIVQEEVFGPVITVQAFDIRGRGPGHGQRRRPGPDAPACGPTTTGGPGDSSGASTSAPCRSTPTPPWAAEMPHGGFGTSGYGKDLSIYGLEDYTRVKHVASAW